MSTVAWDGRFLAADRQATSAHGGIYTTRKISSFGGELLAVTGDESVAADLLAWYRAGARRKAFPECARNDDATLLVIDKYGSRLYTKGPSPMLRQGLITLGSGADYAMAAMHFGQSAEGAVAVACELDAFSGGGVDVLEAPWPAEATRSTPVMDVINAVRREISAAPAADPIAKPDNILNAMMWLEYATQAMTNASPTPCGISPLECIKIAYAFVIDDVDGAKKVRDAAFAEAPMGDLLAGAVPGGSWTCALEAMKAGYAVCQKSLPRSDSGGVWRVVMIRFNEDVEVLNRILGGDRLKREVQDAGMEEGEVLFVLYDGLADFDAGWSADAESCMADDWIVLDRVFDRSRYPAGQAA